MDSDSSADEEADLMRKFEEIMLLKEQDELKKSFKGA